MKLQLLNTTRGLVPCYDDDFEEKKKLKIGVEYTAEVRTTRNPMFHRKYFALINAAWELLPESKRTFFGTKENFRDTVQVSAGYFQNFWQPDIKQWVHIPCSISFSSMSEEKFSDLYRDVRNVIDRVLYNVITPEEFEKVLMNF